MSRTHVTVTLTDLEARALYRLAECAANTYDDAEAVLVQPTYVRAGFRAIAKLRKARLVTFQQINHQHRSTTK